MKPENYFDHASTTFLLPEARRAMLPWLSCANPHSLHELGRETMAMVEECRARCGAALGAEDPSQIIFTSGATEANNWIAYLYRDGLAISPFEHSSMREPALHYGAQVMENHSYALSAVEGAILQSVMAVNNETGAILSSPDKIFTHSDITQAVGKVDIQLSHLAFASMSAHKFGGPKGVGILFARNPANLRPFHYGGEHELGLRAGTLNVAGIVGMTEALELAIERQPQNAACYSRFKSIVLDTIGGATISNDGPHAPSIVNLSFPDIQGETLVIEMDALGFGISSGAACSSRSQDPSHVLMALEYSQPRIAGSIRISFGESNSEASVIEMIRALNLIVRNLN